MQTIKINGVTRQIITYEIEDRAYERSENRFWRLVLDKGESIRIAAYKSYDSIERIPNEIENLSKEESCQVGIPHDGPKFRNPGEIYTVDPARVKWAVFHQNKAGKIHRMLVYFYSEPHSKSDIAANESGREKLTDREHTQLITSAEMRQNNLIFSLGAMPEGEIGNSLRQLTPDEVQIMNLRIQTDEKGNQLSWSRIAELFRRPGKAYKKYTAERCRQIYTLTVKKHPALAEYVNPKAQARRKPGAIDEQKNKTLHDEAEEQTGYHRGSFDRNDLNDDKDQTPGYRVTKNPRKPI